MRILFDLECTCWEDNKQKQEAEMEVIQIGAVKFCPKTFETIDCFMSYAKPSINPILTDFCKDLTGIQQKDVDSGTPFKDTYQAFMSWSGDCPLFLAWGAFDHRQLQTDCSRAGIECFPPRKYLNAKSLYTYFTGMRGGGLGKKLRAHGMHFEGRQHDALEDALNTVRLLKAAWREF